MKNYDFFVCPNCKKKIHINNGQQDTICDNCNEKYTFRNNLLNIIPSKYKKLKLYNIWTVLQQNGNVSYVNDPMNNLSVGERNICIKFRNFCNYIGKVLDIGCGPQEWPAYFVNDKNVTFVGVDPIITTSSSKYLQIKAVGEFLPFVDNTFEQIIFVTSLDHVIDINLVLSEAIRVLKDDGEINVMIGEKLINKPVSKSSPDWYLSLVKPEGADDVFHLKRLKCTQYQEIFNKAGLEIINKETYDMDEIRKVHFLKLIKNN